MGHPAMLNDTPFAAETLFTIDADGRPIAILVVKATYEIRPGGTLALAESQRPVHLTGERWSDGPEASWKYEPECLMAKPATDVVLVGSAHARSRTTREMEVGFRLGPLQKRLYVVGDRTWVKRLGGGIGVTDAAPFASIPLTWERAFGGWDRSAADPAKHGFEARNPVGRGFRQGRGSFEPGLALPNVEDPKDRLRSFGDRPVPAGVGFTSPDWQPRARFAGTYDASWVDTRMPRLPSDFDRRFLNAAAPGLVAPGYLRGDEPVVLSNVTSEPELGFRLPRVPHPACTFVHRRTGTKQPEAQLDTVIVDADARAVMLLWRTGPVPGEPHDVRELRIHVDGIPIHTT